MEIVSTPVANKKTTQTVALRKEMVARDGIEPPTQGFSVPCSTN